MGGLYLTFLILQWFFPVKGTDAENTYLTWYELAQALGARASLLRIQEIL